jgi:hypothetical protein
MRGGSMSARNTFVTSFLYWPAAINVVENVLQQYTDNINFFGRRDNGGYFCGRMNTISGPPLMLEDVLEEIDTGFSNIEYEVYFDIAIVCDDAKMVLHRLDLYGLELDRTDLG